MIKGIAIQDWIYLAVGIIGIISAWLQSRTRLPANVRKYLDRVSTENVVNAIVWAQEHADTPEKRRMLAVEKLQEFGQTHLGFKIPTSIVNLMVEYVYQQYKKRFNV